MDFTFADGDVAGPSEPAATEELFKMKKTTLFGEWSGGWRETVVLSFML